MKDSQKGFIGIVLLIILGLLIIGGGAYYFGVKHKTDISATASTTDEYNNYIKLNTKTSSSTSDSLTIQSPQPNTKVKLPIDVKGIIRKSDWSIFEGQAGTVQIFDANNRAVGMAMPLKIAENNYNYTYPVQVEATVGNAELMSSLKTTSGYLRFTVENAKGDPNPEYFDVPIKFDISANSTTTTTVSNTSNWKTYTNAQYGFSFMFPTDMRVDVLAPTRLDSFLLSLVIGASQKDFVGGIDIYRNTGPSTTAQLESIVKDWYGISDLNKIPLTNAKITETSISGHPAIIVSYAYSVEHGPGSPSALVFILNQNWVFRISFMPWPSSTASDIISTFRFITADISNWKTYTDSTYGYTIKYPSNWIVEDNIISSNVGRNFCPPELADNTTNPISCKMVLTNSRSADTLAPILLIPYGNPPPPSSTNYTILGVDSSNRFTLELYLSNQNYLSVYNQMIASFKFTS